jgi:RNA polymerase sigma-70 factor (ECF subfamily)
VSAHVDDLQLASAAGRGEPQAVRELEQLIVAASDTVARRIDRAPAFRDELRQAVRVRLLVAEGGRARIADYAGRGPLRGWLAVVTLRVALNLRRRVATASPDVLAELVSREDDPELHHLKTLYRAEFRDALEAGLTALSDRHRAVLRLSCVDGVKLRHLARLYGVHETTAARWVTHAAEAVAETARGHLMARLAMSPSSLDSVARMVLSHLDFSIARVLGG